PIRNCVSSAWARALRPASSTSPSRSRISTRPSPPSAGRASKRRPPNPGSSAPTATSSRRQSRATGCAGSSSRGFSRHDQAMVRQEGSQLLARVDELGGCERLVEREHDDLLEKPVLPVQGALLLKGAEICAVPVNLYRPADGRRVAAVGCAALLEDLDQLLHAGER